MEFQPTFIMSSYLQTIETELNLTSVIFQDDIEGPEYLDIIESERISGKSDIKIITEIVDPTKLTGDTYEITFGSQHYYLDENSNWVKTNFPDSIGKTLNKPNDQSPSKLVPLPSVYAPNNTLDLHLIVENNSPDLNYIDAISITFPEGIIINSANDIFSNHSAFPYIDQQTVTWGEPGALSADGAFTGGEELIININYVQPTFSVEYEIFDDGWAEAYAFTDSQYFRLGNGTINGTGTLTFTGEIAYQFKTEKYWQLFNKTKNVVSLEYETALSGKDFNSKENLPYNYEPEVDGFRIKLDGTFEAPINFFNLELNEGSPTILTSISSRENLDIQNYTIFGGVENSWAIDNFGVGTTDVDQLQQDYELRFTGIYDEGTSINGQTVYQISMRGDQLLLVLE